MNMPWALLVSAVSPRRRAKNIDRLLRAGHQLGPASLIQANLRCGISSIETAYLERYRIWMDLSGRSITESVLATGSFQNDLFGTLSRYVVDRSLCFVNVGANIGTTCLNAHHGGFRRFAAFEPVAANFKLLAMNLEQLKADSQVQAMRIALGERREERDIFLDRQSTGRHSLVRDAGHGVERVAVHRLDDVAPQEAALLWIDAEGYEAEILRGGAGFIAQYCRGMCLEITPPLLGREGLDHIEAVNAAHFGRCVTPDGAVTSSLSEIEAIVNGRQTDVVFLPRDGAR